MAKKALRWNDGELIDWFSLVPIIVRIVGPQILNTISHRYLHETPEKEREKQKQLLRHLSDEITKLVLETKEKRELVEKIHELAKKLNSQIYQQSLRPDVANVVMKSLKHARKQKKKNMLATLRQLRTLLNTWIHDLKFTGTPPRI